MKNEPMALTKNNVIRYKPSLRLPFLKKEMPKSSIENVMRTKNSRET